MWMMIVSAWVLVSFPLAVLVGKVFAGSSQPVPVCAVAEPIVDVDALLERIFAA